MRSIAAVVCVSIRQSVDVENNDRASDKNGWTDQDVAFAEAGGSHIKFP